jgi:hypothetical protein
MPEFLWDERPGGNVDKIAAHGMDTATRESVYDNATAFARDKDDISVVVAEGKAHRQLYRIIYRIDDDDGIIPLAILPITGMPIKRRGLRQQ